MAGAIRRAAIAGMLMACASAAAFAQEVGRGAGRAEWGGFPGGAIVVTRSTENALPDFTNYTLGTSFTWNFNPWVGLEAEAGFGFGGKRAFTVDGRRLEEQPMPDLATYSGSVVVSPIGNRRIFVPYVAGGLGAFTIVPRNGTDALGITGYETMLTGNVGGGVKWYAPGPWGLRADYRLLILNHDDQAPLLFGDPGVRHVHRVYAGIFATF